MGQVTGPIISTTLVLLAVFVPVGFCPASPDSSTNSSP
jgi:multidrug efflux pump subunit AcrB